MFSDRLLIMLLAFFFLSSFTRGQDFQVGETVVVATANTDVESRQEKLGSVSRGIKFKVRQKNNSWLLGEFRIGNQTELGWIQKKDVRRVELTSADTKTHDFTWENLFLARVKLDKDYDFEAHVDDYLKTFRPDVWKRYHDDEFQLEKKRIEALRIFKQRVEEFDLDQEFIIPSATVNIDKYDFEHAAFPIKEATDHHYWYKSRSTGSQFPSSFNVYFKNPELMKYLPMPADEAEQFLVERKSTAGYVDRELLAYIRVRICKKKNEQGDELLSEIGGVQFFSNGKRKQLLYQTPEAPREVPAVPEASESNLPELAGGLSHEVAELSHDQDTGACLPPVTP